jgi:1,4-dihydroxy-2-naphthoyl-CoA synthase
MLDNEARNAPELGFVGSDDGQAFCQCVGADQKVVGTDQRTPAFENGSDLAVLSVSRLRERQDFDRAEHRFELIG